jgi:hypothetical protein
VTISYVVPVHKNPEQVLRLIRRLQSDSATFLVHVDARAEASMHRALEQAATELERVELLDPLPCRWGGIGLVLVGLQAIERSLRGNAPFDHLVYVTGQDYPLAPASEIESFFASAPGRSFLSFFELPGAWGESGLARLERWHLVGPVALHLRLPWRRRLPGGLRPFGGGAHWALARPAAEYVHEFTRRNPRLLRFCRHALHPDELYFQTVLLNSPLAGTVVDDNLRYIDWSGEPAPKVLRTEDFDMLVTSDKLFARKFDVTVDAEVLDRLDLHTEEKHARVG